MKHRIPQGVEIDSPKISKDFLPSPSPHPRHLGKSRYTAQRSQDSIQKIERKTRRTVQPSPSFHPLLFQFLILLARSSWRGRRRVVTSSRLSHVLCRCNARNAILPTIYLSQCRRERDLSSLEATSSQVSLTSSTQRA